MICLLTSRISKTILLKSKGKSLCLALQELLRNSRQPGSTLWTLAYVRKKGATNVLVTPSLSRVVFDCYYHTIFPRSIHCDDATMIRISFCDVVTIYAYYTAFSSNLQYFFSHSMIQVANSIIVLFRNYRTGFFHTVLQAPAETACRSAPETAPLPERMSWRSPLPH